MPKFNAMVTRTVTVESHYEFENVTAKDAEAAEEKVTALIEAANTYPKKLDDKYNFEEDNTEEDFEYSVDEA